jgi:uncharacterized protein (DUF305 family)
MIIVSRWICILVIVICGICLPAQAAAQHEDMAQMSANTAFEHEMMENMKKMNNAMMAAPVTGDPDLDFIAMMTPHHQGAIDMAKTYLLHGKDPVLRRMAQEIIVTQQQEIEAMRLRQVALHTGASNVSG